MRNSSTPLPGVLLLHPLPPSIMRWQKLDVLPPLDQVVLLWLEAGPVLAARKEDDAESSGWYWVGAAREYSADEPLRWAVIIPPRL